LSNRCNITDADIATIRQVHRCLLEILAVPIGPLEHAVQAAHESAARQKEDPQESFETVGVTRQALRMFWHFRCNIEAVMPSRREG